MKDIFTAPFVREMRETTGNMYRLGWDERNGGNISLLLDTEEVAEYLNLDSVIRTIPMGFDASSLIGKIFMTPLPSSASTSSSPAPASILRTWTPTRRPI